MGAFFREFFPADAVTRSEPELWIAAISSCLIAASFFCIPATLIYVIRKRSDARLSGTMLVFAGLIVTAGLTRIFGVWSLWHPEFQMRGLANTVTAAISVITAIVAIRLVPVLLKLASPEQLEEINRNLRDQIAARDQAEQKLRQVVESELLSSKDQLRSFFEAASQGILGVTTNGRIAVVNRRTEEMFGYSREELLGQELEILLPERFREVHVADRDGYFSEPRMRAMGVGMDLVGRCKDGTEFPIEIGLSYVNTPEGPLAYGMVSDISERKKAADELQRVNEDLRRSNVEIEQFAHIASHDLQEPLRMVTSYLQLIERRYSAYLDADGREFMSFAVDGAKRMKALIKDLLEFSRAGTNAANIRAVTAGSILQNALDNLKTAIDESHAQITADPLPTILVDPYLFTQVFQNLIANAMKFQKSGAPAVHISAQRRGGEWVFAVRDNGIGIEQRHLDRIFRIFERLHTAEEYSGSGIGLAVTKKIVERHGGTMWVESQPGAGSTFYFSASAETGIASAAKSG